MEALVVFALALVGAGCSVGSGANGSTGGSGGVAGRVGSATGGSPTTGTVGSGNSRTGGSAAGGLPGQGQGGSTTGGISGGGGSTTGGISGGGGSTTGGTSGGGGSVGGSGLGGGTGTAGNAGAGGSSGGQAGTRDAGADASGGGGSTSIDAGGFATPFTPVPAGGASKVTDPAASGGSSVGLAGTGQGAGATGLPAASKLAIHYASVSVGTISVSVNNQTAVKVNVHSSGALTGSFLYAIISIAIPANASVTVSHASGDVAVNIDKLIVGDGDLGLPPDIWNLPTFQPATGAYAADWTKLGLTYSAPEWWRDAKFGAWAHWDPQSMPEQGDWYALEMYKQGSADFNYQVAHFGDPGGTNPYGYKDICKNWVIDQWDPKSLMDLYVQMGAKYFMAMGTHHDNFACYDSIYQQWNAAKVGVKQDIVATWEPLARQAGLRFGIGFHNTPARTWGQWMPVRYTSDAKGPYDAMNTILDGKGKWWEGMDPVNLYGYQHTTDCSNDSCNSSPYGTQFMYRVDEAIDKYHPDYIYFDDQAGPAQVDLGVHMGLFTIAPTILANFYNKSLTWNQGKAADVVMSMKGVYGPDLASFQANDPIVPYVQRALVRCSDHTESDISAYPFLTDWDIQDNNWHYMAGAGYNDAVTLVTQLMQNVARNGSFVLNLTQHGRGNLDPQPIQIAKDIGAWLAVNGEAVYSSRPFEVSGDSTVLYSRNNGNVYATLFGWNGGAVTLTALKSNGATLGTVSKVEMVGSTVAMTFSQSGQGLTVTPSGSVPALSGISDSQLASKIRVLRITHDKGWFNDDDPGAVYPGWLRKSNLGTGDYNNDLTTSTTTGDTWTSTFTGTSVSVYAPKESGDGKIEIQVDGQVKDTADLSASGTRQAQQLVSAVTGLSAGQHTLSIINRGPGPVAVDAIVVK